MFSSFFAGGIILNVIATTSHGWDHASVTVQVPGVLSRRCPTWEEMEFVRKILFRHDESVMQLHVPEKDHIDIHPYCLHLWRPQDVEIPRPPNELVM